jgi:putative acyl-CoA dehydrogenase
MSGYADDGAFRTHEVENQPPPLSPYNLYTSDAALREAVTRNGAAWAHDELTSHGAALGRPETFELGFQANQNPPKLHTHDRYGRRRDEVEFHPAWHDLMALSIGVGTHTGAWADPKPGAHVARGAKVILTTQVEAGIQCPITMTYGVVPALRQEPALAADYLPKLFSRSYDRRFLPIEQKAGMLIGMGMTEKQGGTDLRTNATRAEPIGNDAYRITGHKWFFSAPMCDAFLVLAQTAAGPTCFFLPRFTPDGELNAIRIQRLKSKLGNHSNASSEVEFHGAWARRVGAEGRGIPTIIEMATYTRLDCALGTTGLMRQAVSQAAHHAANRTVFQRRLNDQPLMQNVLADLAIEVEAAIALSLRLARAVDNYDAPGERAFHRLMTPAIKYWICKRGIVLAGEAMEVLGGVGYTEETIMPRLYREMPVNSIWEGSGNVMCLDVLRALQRTSEALAMVLDDLKPARGDRRLDRHLTALEVALRDPAGIETRARRLVESLVLAVQAALLIQHAPAPVADAFVAGRLDGGWSGAFGTLPAGLDFRGIIDRATPGA